MLFRSAPLADARRALGALGERLARQQLEALGSRIIDVNHRTRWGEIDLLALDGDCLVFVEVRARRGDAHGSPAESVVGRKAAKLAALAEDYLAEHPEYRDCRVDVVAVQFSTAGRLQSVEVIRDAVS